MKKCSLLFIAVFFIFLNTRAQTFVTGKIYVNTIWTKANSPYILTDTVIFEGGVSLTIQPGVIVKFNDKALIVATGSISANGTSSDSIIFTSNSATPFQGIYSGIQGYSSSSYIDSLRYCRFTYAAYAMVDPSYSKIIIASHCLFNNDYTGIRSFTNGGNIDTCVFQYDSVGIYSEYYINNVGTVYENNYIGLEYGIECMLSNCIFRNNTYGFYQANQCIIEYSTFDSNEYGVTLMPYDSIKNCIIKYNAIGVIGFASVIESNDISDNAIGINLISRDTITCNTFCNNSLWNIVLEDSINCSASDNYWCLTDSAQIQATIYDKYQNSWLGYLYFTPFYTAACADVPTSVKESPATSESINLYPNPNSGSFTLSLSHVNDKCTLEIYNVMGQKVNFSCQPRTPKGALIAINMENQPNGIYLYRVLKEDGGLVGEGKVVIEK